MSPHLDENDVRKVTVTHALRTVKRIAGASFIFLLPLATHRVTIGAAEYIIPCRKGSSTLTNGILPAPGRVAKRDNIADGSI